jgi:hypothetical protein
MHLNWQEEKIPMRRGTQFALALLIAGTISSQPSMAQGRGHAFARSRNAANSELRVHNDDRAFVRRPRQTVIFTDFRTRANRPPGWNRGRKVGWGNCDVPPGQAKKFGCRGYTYRVYDPYRGIRRFDDDDRFRERERVRTRTIIVVPFRR